MPLLVTGISHHTAPLQIRERLAFGREDYAREIEALSALDGVEEAILVSTCNRSEVYGLVRPGHENVFREWLMERGRFTVEELDQHLYSLTDEETVGHLFRVACGLDSLVLGEPQIMGQLKDAWNAARAAGGAGKLTDRLFQRAFSTSKRVRSETGISDHPISVAYIASVLARQIFGDLSDKCVLLVGAGEMITLCGRHFRRRGVRELLIANRSLDRARKVAATCDGIAIPLDHLESRLPDADIVISSTGSKTPIIEEDLVERTIRQRRRKPMFMVDLAVPRDIAPAIGEMDDIYLYTIDDLRQVADENQSHRRNAAEEAIDSIELAQAEYMRWMHGTRAADSLRRLRQQAERNGAELARRALHQIESGGDAAAVIEQFANTLTHKLLHTPSFRLRQAAEEDHLDILKAADWLFEAVPAGDNGDDDTFDPDPKEPGQ